MFGDALRDLLDPRLRGRSGQLRRRRETQTRILGPADQPFQRVSPWVCREHRGSKTCPCENGEETVPFIFLRIAVFSSSSSLGHWEESGPREPIPCYEWSPPGQPWRTLEERILGRLLGQLAKFQSRYCLPNSCQRMVFKYTSLLQWT